ncbi:SUMF1/EgtB/PvdO family nonheme iron enzyme [Breznakiellaceae bacterium SP9]
MKRLVLVGITLVVLAFQLTAQAKPRLAILPFSGGDGEEGETIAELFSFEPALTAAFIPVPRTRITAAIRSENLFQMGTTWTDPDTVAALGKQLGAQYALAGHITALGNNKLLVISILQIEHLQEVAGDLQTYRSIEEIPAKLPAMVQTIVNATKVDTAKLPKLAVVPVQLQGGQAQEAADVPAQILSLYVVRSGRYAVYPRTSSLDQVQKEYPEQTDGKVADERIARIGAGDNPRYVLSAIARKLGTLTMFNASVIDLESGGMINGASANYRTLDDGISAMASLTNTLTGIKIAAPEASTQSTAAPADMVRIQGGTFMMGSPSSEAGRDSDEVQHRVTVSGFSIEKYEVTVANFRAFVQATGYRTDAETSGGAYVWIGSEWVMKADANWKNPYFTQTENSPVTCVSWNDAVNYCNWKSRQEGLTPAYTINGTNVTWNRSANGYRLPTEAEWEYACRAGTTTPFSTGSNITTNQANYDGNYPYNGNAKGTYRQKTTPVGSFAPNSWGLYDMHGNVWEWCWDWYGSYSSSAQTDPMGAASGSARVCRGGGCYDDAAYLRSAYRFGSTPTDRYYYLGFRVVRP